jgi:hypothetical protein
MARRLGALRTSKNLATEEDLITNRACEVSDVKAKLAASPRANVANLHFLVVRGGR